MKQKKELKHKDYNKIGWMVLIIGISLSLIVGFIATMITYSEIMGIIENSGNSYSNEVIEGVKNQALRESIKKGVWYAIIPLYTTFVIVGFLELKRKSIS